jgi:hypothetical protein
MHLVDETTYRNYFQHVDAAQTRENHAMMEQDVSSRLRNSELEDIIKCFLVGLLNKWKKDMSNVSSRVSCEPATAGHECVRDMSSGRTKRIRSPACEKGVMKVSTAKTSKITKTKAKTQRNRGNIPIAWDPI